MSAWRRIRAAAVAAIGAARTDALTDWDPADAATQRIRVDGLDLPLDLATRLVWSPVQDAMAPGYRVDIDAEDARLGIPAKVAEAMATARESRVAYLWLIERGAEDYSVPMEPGAEIAAIHVLERQEVEPYSYERDPESSNWSLPVLSRVTPKRDHVQMPPSWVHHTRLIRVLGTPATPRHRGKHGEGRSALELYARAIYGYDLGWTSASDLMERRSMPMLEHPGGPAVNAGTSNRSAIAAALDAFWDGYNSPAKLMVATPGTKLSWSSPAVAGSGELLGALAARITAVEGRSITGIFGTPPGGLSTDDEAGRRTDERCLRRIQGMLGDVLLEVYEHVLGPNESRRVVWGPLSSPTPLEQAQTSLALAQRDQVLIASLAIEPEEARARHADGEECAELVLQDRDEEEAEMYGELVEDPDTGAPERATSAGVAEVDPREVLNGAQIQALVGLVQQVRAGELPREGAINIMVSGLGMTEKSATSFFDGLDALPPIGVQDGAPPDET